jgi:hypothetical protein
MTPRQREREHIIERFMAQVATVPDEKGCMLWRGYAAPNGYGSFTVRAGHSELAHRIAYKIVKQQPFERQAPVVAVEPRKRDDIIRHECHNKRCMTVGPGHIVRGTQRENINDNVRDGRILRGEQIGTSKLTAVQVREIIAAYASWPKSAFTGKPKRGVLQRLAEQYGVTRQMVWQIVTGRWWRHCGTVQA